MSRRTLSLLRLLGAGVLAIVLGLPVGLGLFRSERPLGVETRVLQRGAFAATLAYRGRLVSRDEVALSSNLVGKVERVLVREGETVHRGQPLVLLDARQAEAALKSARSNLVEMQAALANARTQQQRAEALFQEQLISRAEYDNRRTDSLLAAARVESASGATSAQEKTLDLHTVRAPSGGIVTSLQVKEGSVVVVGSMNNPATVMLTIANLARLEVELQMNEVDFGRTRLGMPAVVRFPAFADLQLAGKVHDYNVKAVTRNPGWDDEETFVNVYVALEQVPPFLKPGLTSRVDLTLASDPAALSVPIQAVLKRDAQREAWLFSHSRSASGEAGSQEAAAAEDGTRGGPRESRDGVFVVDPTGRLRFVPVAVKVSGADEVAIDSPALKAGDRVVVGPFSQLKALHAGLRVDVKEAR